MKQYRSMRTVYELHAEDLLVELKGHLWVLNPVHSMVEPKRSCLSVSSHRMGEQWPL